MEYTEANFEADFEKLKCMIDNCDFVSIDTELTGLIERTANLYDTPELRYKSVKDYGMKYTVTQFGMCLFKFNKSYQHFEYRPLNFLLKPFTSFTEKDNFLMNVDTIDFLQKHNFDFNRNWKLGIPFMKYSDIEDKIKHLNLKKEHELSKVDLDPEIFDFSQLNNLIDKCKELLANDSESELKTDKPADPLDTYLIFNEMWKKVGCINGQWVFPVLEEDKQTIMIKKTFDARNEAIQSISKSFENKLEQLSKVRFSGLIKQISDSKKLIITHNGFMDIMHMMDKFIEPLPEDYSTFKKRMNHYFPKIIDVRYLFGDRKLKYLKPGSLENIYNLTKQEPFLNPDQVTRPASREYDFGDETALHTAHYDAMITGKIFVSSATFVGGKRINIWNNINIKFPGFLDRYVNKIRIVQAEFGTFNLNLDECEKVNSRELVFHMTIPNEWENDDILRYLCTALSKPYKSLHDGTKISRLNDTSVMIKMSFYMDQKEILSKLANVDERVKIVPFDEYHNKKDNYNCEMAEDEYGHVKRLRLNFQF